MMPSKSDAYFFPPTVVENFLKKKKKKALTFVGRLAGTKKNKLLNVCVCGFVRMRTQMRIYQRADAWLCLFQYLVLFLLVSDLISGTRCKKKKKETFLKLSPVMICKVGF